MRHRNSASPAHAITQSPPTCDPIGTQPTMAALDVVVALFSPLLWFVSWFLTEVRSSLGLCK